MAAAGTRNAEIERLIRLNGPLHVVERSAADGCFQAEIQLNAAHLREPLAERVGAGFLKFRSFIARRAQLALAWALRPAPLSIIGGHQLFRNGRGESFLSFGDRQADATGKTASHAAIRFISNAESLGGSPADFLKMTIRTNNHQPFYHFETV